ncbi:MAG: rRNA maturation RNase YbeY [FCB group bacterium]|nr:rRNA maturation RNase YbeY [FCB group bacterium]
MSRSIRFFNEDDLDVPIKKTAVRKLLAHVLHALDKSKYDIRVIATSDEALRKMKEQYFNEDVYTDIISFIIDTEPLLDGELYYSPERIRRNAEAFSEAEDREYARVLIHGICHLCGYTDGSEAEKEEMTQLENMFLTKYVDGRSCR